MRRLCIIGLAALVGSLALQAAGCSDDDSTATDASVGVPDSALEVDSAVTDCTDAIELTNSDIAGGTTLPAGTCYLVNENLVLNGGTVVAEAGVVLQFATGKSFSVKSGSQLKLAGTAGAHVRLTSQDSAATWKGVQLTDSQGSDNSWTFAEIDRAGDAQWTGAAYSSAAVYLTGSTKLAMDHVTISNSESHGLLAFEDVDFSFTNGTFDGNDTPAYLHPEVASRIGAETVFTGNTNPYIRVVFGNSDAVESAQTWPAHIYRVEDRFFVKGPLTIAAGAVIEFAQDASVIIEANGSLTAEGSEAETITFKGASASKGFWKGIEVRSGGSGTPVIVGATFDHCVISDAGGQQWSGAAESSASLYLQQTSAAKIVNTSFTNSARYAVWAGADARLPEFGNNSFSGNTRVMILHPDRVGELSGSSTVSGNDDDGIYVVFGNSDRVTVDATWKDLQVPYVVRDRFFVEAALTIEHGVTIHFPQDQGMIVDTAGSLTVNGTAADPVLLRGDNEVATGYWQGLRIESNSSANKLTYATLTHAGSKGWTGSAESNTAIYLDNNAQITLENVTLGPGGGYGVVLAGAASDLGCSNVTFASLVKGNIWQASPGSVLATCP